MATIPPRNNQPDISNIPDRVDIRHRQASTLSWQMHFKQPDGTDEDISDRDYVLSIKKSAAADVPIRQFGMVDPLEGISFNSDGCDGLLDVTIDDVAEPLPYGTFVYDLDEIVPTGFGTATETFPIMLGTFEVAADR